MFPCLSLSADEMTPAHYKTTLPNVFPVTHDHHRVTEQDVTAASVCGHTEAHPSRSLKPPKRLCFWAKSTNHKAVGKSPPSFIIEIVW